MKLRIKEFREELRLTQKELADKINNVQRNVSNWENGTSEPDCETILQLAEIFDVPIDELFGRTFSGVETQSFAGVELKLLKMIKKMPEAQKFALLQFLREINNIEEI